MTPTGRLSKMKPQYIDLKYLHEISGGEKDLILEMISIFNTEVLDYLSLMNSLLEEKNWDSLGKLAHKAKASASIMGMKQLTNDLRDLELLAKENKDSELYSYYIKIIKNQFISAIEELKLISKDL